MGYALYITLEHPISGFDPFVNGKAIGAAQELLEDIAAGLGVQPLMRFFSVDPSAAADLISMADFDLDQVVIPDECWFDPADGLKTVNALMDYLARSSGSVESSTQIIEDLVEFQRVLQRASAAQTRWHLSADF